MQLRVDVTVDPNPWFDEITVLCLIDLLCIDVDLDLTLEVIFENDLDGDRGGFCYAPQASGEHGAHGWLSISPKACQKDREDVLRTLCHELIHLEQYVEERLVEDHVDQTFVWFTPPWTFSRIPMTCLCPPWEDEAEREGLRLYRSFFQ